MGVAHGNVGVRPRIAAEIVAIFATPVVLVACAIANFNQTALLTLVVVLASIGVFFASYEASRPRLRDIMPTVPTAGRAKPANSTAWARMSRPIAERMRRSSPRGSERVREGLGMGLVYVAPLSTSETRSA